MNDTDYTADDWSLFTQMAVAPGAPTRDEVAADLNAALADSIRTSDYSYIEHEMKHHSAAGANDSEAHNFAERKYRAGIFSADAAAICTYDTCRESTHVAARAPVTS